MADVLSFNKAVAGLANSTLNGPHYEGTVRGRVTSSELGIIYIREEILVCPVQDKMDSLGRALENFCTGPFFTAQAVDHRPFLHLLFKETKQNFSSCSSSECGG